MTPIPTYHYDSKGQMLHEGDIIHCRKQHYDGRVEEAEGQIQWSGDRWDIVTEDSALIPLNHFSQKDIL